MLGSYENIFQELFQIWKHFPLTQQNENKNAYECKANGNLNEQHIKFSNVQNHKKSYSKNNFSNYFTFFANRNK